MSLAVQFQRERVPHASRAAQALAAREAEAGPVKVPGAKQQRTAKRDGEKTPKQGRAASEAQQPRMSVG